MLELIIFGTILGICSPHCEFALGDQNELGVDAVSDFLCGLAEGITPGKNEHYYDYGERAEFHG